MWNPLSKKSAPDLPTVTLEQLTTLAVEHWRLAGALAAANTPAPARHALRKIGDVLGSLGIEAQSLDGQPHDPGMSAKVVDRVADPGSAGGDVIVETVSPLVTLHGQVIRQAEVVVGAAT
jgi:hypothetical protein